MSYISVLSTPMLIGAIVKIEALQGLIQEMFDLIAGYD